MQLKYYPSLETKNFKCARHVPLTFEKVIFHVWGKSASIFVSVPKARKEKLRRTWLVSVISGGEIVFSKGFSCRCALSLCALLQLDVEFHSIRNLISYQIASGILDLAWLQYLYDFLIICIS